jgi:plasmid maintenance system killer protein
MPDVIKLLEQDHREVEDLFANAESTSGAAKQQVVTKIATELTMLRAAVDQQTLQTLADQVREMKEANRG